MRYGIANRLNLREAVAFVDARLGRAAHDLELLGITFPDVDRVVWTQMLHIIFLEEYSLENVGVARGDVVLDVGANRGVFLAHAMLKGAGRVLAFEPSRENYLHLIKLVETNRFAGVDVFRMAVSEHGGPVKLLLSDRHTRHSIVPEHSLLGSSQSGEEVVESETLDGIVASFGPVDLMKMDCEGAEYETVLAASADTLKSIQKMVIEYHGARDSRALESLLERLRSAGFSLTVVPDRFGDPYGLVFAAAKHPRDGQ
jgi:FkbM family methyltransferase